MRRITVILIAVLFLCGCSQAEPPLQTTQATTEAAELTLTTQPSIFSPASCYAALPVGANLACFSTEGSQTRISLVSSEDGSVLSSATIGEDLSSQISSVRSTGSGICYYSVSDKCLIFLNATLDEVRRVHPSVPHYGMIVISEDWTNAFYSDGDNIIDMNLETGISAAIYSKPGITLLGSLYSGHALLLSDEDGNTFYISSENGSCLPVTDTMEYLRSDSGCCVVLANSELLVSGPAMEKIWRFTQAADDIFPLSGRNVLISVDYQKDQTSLNFWDLETGDSRGSYMLPALQRIYGILWNPIQNRIWICGVDVHSGNFLKGITPDVIGQGSSQCAFSPYYTEENPDIAGLAFCQSKMDTLSEKYPVEISIGGDFSRLTGNYRFTDNYIGIEVAPMFSRLSGCLKQLPEGFLEKALSETADHTLHIVFYRTVEGTQPQCCPGALVEFEGSYYLALPTDETMEHAFFHSLGHLVANRVRTHSMALDDWLFLNPRSFDYTMKYASEEDDYMDEDNRFFASLLSTTYPMEDYAEVFAYALLPDGQPLFQSDIMQSKLTRLCTGIRESFDLEKSTEVLPWEKYLEP